MISVRIEPDGQRIVLAGLDKLADELPRLLKKSLSAVAIGIYRDASDWLNGPGGLNTYETKTSRSGKSYQKKTGSKIQEYEGFKRRDGSGETFRRYTDSGGYPVPVRTGHLRRSLNWVAPGASKTSNGDTFTAGADEVIVYNSAAYAMAVHEGRNSSARFGRRAFLDDAFSRFNESGLMLAIVEEEISKAVAAKGLA